MDCVLDALLRSLAELVPYTCARVLVPGRWSPLAGAGRKIMSRTCEKVYSQPTDVRCGRIPLFSTHLGGTKTSLDLGYETGAGVADVRGTCAIPFLAWGPLACLRGIAGERNCPFPTLPTSGDGPRSRHKTFPAPICGNLL